MMKSILALILAFFTLTHLSAQQDTLQIFEELDSVCVFEMQDGLLVIEMESVPTTEDWIVENTRAGAKGDGYILWTGDQYFGQRGNGKMVYPIYVSEAGTYRFHWRVGVFLGNSTTEHNDTWLSINAADFYGIKGNGNIVHPRPTCTQSNDCPNGTSGDGFFKIYGGLLTGWVWKAKTSDNDAHEIFVEFSQPGIYQITINARSSYHGIDRMVLWHTNKLTQSAAQDLNNPPSPLNCSGTVQLERAFRLDAKIYVAHGAIQLEVPNGKGTQYELMDVGGRVLEEGVLEEDKTAWKVELPAGLYMVRLSKNQQGFTKKIILNE